MLNEHAQPHPTRGAQAVLLALLTLTFAGPAHGGGYIVQDGEPAAQIVIANESASMTELAAKDLRDVIKRMTGAELPITTEPGDPHPVDIYVGTSAHTDALGLAVADLKHDAYRVASGSDWLALLGNDEDYTPPPEHLWASTRHEQDAVLEAWDEITGRHFGTYFSNHWRSYHRELDLWEADDRGTPNAVYDFLRSLGCRWYFPGELGEVLPERQSIELPEVNKTVQPDFPVRRINQSYQDFGRVRSRSEVLWQLRLGLNRGQEAIGWGAVGHGLNAMHSREQVKQTHPEYYAIWGGKRMTEGQGKPCLSSEGLKQACIQYVRAVFDTYDEPLVQIAPADGYSYLCECEKCRGKDTPGRGRNGRLSDYVWTFVNDVAKEVYKTHPGKSIMCLAYTTYQQPPTSIDKLSPNVAAMICRWRSNFHDKDKRAQFLNLRKAWLEKLPSNELYVWDYYLHCRRNGRWLGIPVYFPHIIAKDLKSLQGLSRGEYVSARRNWPDWNVPWHALAANHLNLYVTARLYWDVEQDVDALLKEYYTKYYGPAAEEMREFIEYAERHWMDAASSVEIMDGYLKRIEAARQAAGDGVYGERVDLVVEYMKPLKQRRAQLAKGREGVPEIRCYNREGMDIELDGRLNDEFWDGIGSHALREIQTGRPAAHPTQFKTGWANGSLYFGITCHEKDMKNLKATADKDGDPVIWRGDSVELLLEPPGHSYYQIAIDPNGHVIDLDRKQGLETRWSSEAEVAVYHGDDFWSVEARLPVAGEGHDVLSPLSGISGRRPTQTHTWFFNVCRQRVREKGMERSAFSPTGTNGFHDVMKFAEMYVR